MNSSSKGNRHRSDSRTRASEEMHIRRQNAVRAEMDQELTFSPKIRSLPSSYGKKGAANSPKDDFNERTKEWIAQRDSKLQQQQEEAKESELRDCSFQPHMGNSRNSYREDPYATNHRGNTSSADNEESNPSASAVGKADPTVQRLYYKETQRLKERRKQERLRQQHEEEEKINATCTFRPTLSSKTENTAATTYEEADIEGAQPRYLHDTEAVERRRMLWAVGKGNEVAPGPGEYERDSGAEDIKRITNHVKISNEYSGGVAANQNYSHANKSRNKNWSFAPQTIGAKHGMDHAREYLKEDVVERLTGKMRADQAHALLGGERGEGEDNYNHGEQPTPNLRSTKPFNPNATNKTTSTTDQFYKSSDSNFGQSSDKSFHEFLARQHELKLRRETHTDLLKAEITPQFTTQMDANSRIIHDASNRGTFLERVDRDEQRREMDRVRQEAKRGELSAECTFQPNILEKSSEMAPRTPYDLAIGDSEAQQMAKRRVRLDVESEELRKFNFKPKTNKNFQSMGGRKVGQAKVGAGASTTEYIQMLKKEEVEKKRARDMLAEEKQEKEMKECTFNPQRTPCPQYIKRIAHSMSISRKHRQAFAEPELPSWK